MSTEGVVGGLFKTAEVEVPEFQGAETVSLEEWADELTSHVNGATVPAMKGALRATFREFCIHSGAWMRQLPPMDLVDGQFRYKIEQPPDARVLYIRAIGYNDSELGASDARGWNAILFPSTTPWAQMARRGYIGGGRPQSFVASLEVGGEFDLFPAPGQDLALALRPIVSLGPIADRADTLPESIHRFHFDVILDGALGRLMSQQEKPYTSLRLASYHLKRFRSGMSRSRDMASRHFSTAESQFMFPAWE